MKKTQLFGIIAISAVSFLSSCKDENKAKNAFIEPDVIPVKVSPVAALELPQFISTTGLISTENEARYSFKIGGVVSRIFVEEGQSFKKGQLLATLNSTEISAGLSQASLGVEKAQRDYARALNLYKDSVFTLEQLQNTKTALDVARKAKDAVAFNEQYSKIFAAADGFVSQKMANESEVVSPGMPVLLTNLTGKTNSYLLKAGVNDREWAMIRLGQTARVTLDGYPDKVFDAVVFQKSRAADQQAGSFQLELKLQLNSLIPAIGMFGKAEIATNQGESVVVIPYDSLVEADGNKAFVFATNGASKVKKIPVSIVRFDNESVYLKKDLDGVNNIVISNSAYLNEQSTIKIVR